MQPRSHPHGEVDLTSAADAELYRPTVLALRDSPVPYEPTVTVTPPRIGALLALVGAVSLSAVFLLTVVPIARTVYWPAHLQCRVSSQTTCSVVWQIPDAVWAAYDGSQQMAFVSGSGERFDLVPVRKPIRNGVAVRVIAPPHAPTSIEVDGVLALRVAAAPLFDLRGWSAPAVSPIPQGP